MTAQISEFPISAYVPLAIAFFGLGTGYLIFGLARGVSPSIMQ